MPKSLIAAVAVLSCAALAWPASGQCDGRWIAGPQARPGGANCLIYARTGGGPAGTGPLAPQLVIAGRFTPVGAGVPANRIASWDGTQWHTFGAGFNNDVRSLATWDPDGPGPLSDQIIAG